MFLSDYFFEDRSGIKLLKLKNSFECEQAAAELIYSNTDSRTALFLSGGSTPKKLYEKFANDQSLTAGAVGMVDERYGGKWHEASNEKMIKETGLLGFLEERKIKFYPILSGKEIDTESENYEETLRFVFSYFPKSIAILGIGEDGHTAGIPSQNHSEFNFSKSFGDPSSLVIWYSDKKKYGERITMSYLSLSQMDILLVLVLGTQKREALRVMFREGSIEEVPARFYLIPEIAKKTILITDQKV